MTETTDNATNNTDGASVEVRRNVPLAAAVGVIAALLAIAFAVRAIGGGGGALDWLALGVMVLITIAYAVALIDSRAPLMVVDDRGVRLRQGSRWTGIAWDDVECMEHLPRRLPLRDGHLLVVGYDDSQLVVPLTMATRVVGATDATLSDTLAELAAGRADVVEVVPGIDEDSAGGTGGADGHDGFGGSGGIDGPDGPQGPGGGADVPPAGGFSDDDPTVERPVVSDDMLRPHPSTPSEAGEDTVDLSELVSADPVEADDETDDPDSVDTGEVPAVAMAPVAPGRTTILAARVDLDGTPRARAGEVRPEVRTDAAPDPLTGPVSDEHATVVLSDLAVQPAPEPVIGPQLQAARERLRLTIDQLSERTRIRPHVIEAIEVDDFAACGGDFYARGHLRTLARVLGIDAAPLVATYDDTYADVPVDPRRVFESELATGHGGSIRSTSGGRNWSVLISAVMGAVLIWSVARLALGGPAPVDHQVPELNQSGGIIHFGGAKADPVKVVLNAAHGGAKVTVRDARGRLVFDGPLAFGQTANLRAVAPVHISTSDGSVTAAVDGKPAKPIGRTGQQASETVAAR